MLCGALLRLLWRASCRNADEPADECRRAGDRRDQERHRHGAHPGRTFPDGQRGKEDESPVREIEIDAFLMDRYEMTQANYAKLVPINGSHFKGPDRPVEMISWGDAALYCNKRSRGGRARSVLRRRDRRVQLRRQRLPPAHRGRMGICLPRRHDHRLQLRRRQPSTLAIRLVCRQRRTSRRTRWARRNRMPGACTTCTATWPNGATTSTRRAIPRTARPSNPHGPEDGPQRVLRGGAWNSRADDCRSACRVGESPGSQDACFARDAIGFRCVRRRRRKP